ncbi:hypothetical protein T06_1701 [Trichinella sp. T6]|nr:hypothetical protein T06_1701 [Trichinella sp. T6]
MNIDDAEEKRKIDKYGYELNFEPADGFDMLARREQQTTSVIIRFRRHVENDANPKRQLSYYTAPASHQTYIILH